jgi:hypothetical protein
MPDAPKRFRRGYEGRNVGYTPDDFAARADECVRLSKMTNDDMIQRELLELRQIYLVTRTRLAARERDKRGDA